MKKLLFILLLSLSSLLYGKAQEPLTRIADKAETYYQKADYSRAIACYQQLLEQSSSPSAALYNNLGNAYYRNGDLALSILAYERALRLAPQEPYIEHNLRIAQSQNEDPLEYTTPYLQEVWRQICYHWQASTWLAIMVLLFVLLLVALLLLFLIPKRKVRQIAFYSSIPLLLSWGLTLIILSSLKNDYRDPTYAIVLEGQVAAKSAPNGVATTLLLLHEGTKVKLQPASYMGTKAAILLPDGRLAWVTAKALAPIYPFHTTTSLAH